MTKDIAEIAFFKKRPRYKSDCLAPNWLFITHLDSEDKTVGVWLEVVEKGKKNERRGFMKGDPSCTQSMVFCLRV